MKKIILAVNNKKIISKIKKDNKNEIINNVQYREAILEIMEENKNIDEIYIEENLPGTISIEKLIEKINIRNKKIKLNIFLEKENINKINKLKKLGIKNIYIKNKIKEKINKNNMIKLNNNIIKNNKINNKINNNILIITGNKKAGKSTIINLLIIYFLEKNKKILIININKKIENNYLIIFNKNNIKYKINKFYKSEKNKYKIFKLFINKNIIFNFIPNERQVNFEEINYQLKKYDYIIVDVGNNVDIQNILKNVRILYKMINVLDASALGIKELKEIARKEQNIKRYNNNSLHIIYNKYYFNFISPLILKNILDKPKSITTIFYKTKLENLAKQISKNKNIKLNNNLKMKIEKMLNKI